MGMPRIVLGSKNLYLSLVVAAFLSYGMWQFYGDLKYYFANQEPVKLGSALQLDTETYKTVKDGAYVEISGIRSIQGGVFKKGATNEEFMVYYLLGSPKFLILEKMSKDDSKNAGGTQLTVKGRLSFFSTGGSAKRMKQFFAGTYRLDMAEDGAMIERGLVPHSDHKAPVIFAGMALLFVLNIVLLVRSYRKNEEFQEYEEYDVDKTEGSGNEG